MSVKSDVIGGLTGSPGGPGGPMGPAAPEIPYRIKKKVRNFKSSRKMFIQKTKLKMQGEKSRALI